MKFVSWVGSQGLGAFSYSVFTHTLSQTLCHSVTSLPSPSSTFTYHLSLPFPSVILRGKLDNVLLVIRKSEGARVVSALALMGEGTSFDFSSNESCFISGEKLENAKLQLQRTFCTPRLNWVKQSICIVCLYYCVLYYIWNGENFVIQLKYLKKLMKKQGCKNTHLIP